MELEEDKFGRRAGGTTPSDGCKWRATQRLMPLFGAVVCMRPPSSGSRDELCAGKSCRPYTALLSAAQPGTCSLKQPALMNDCTCQLHSVLSMQLPPSAMSMGSNRCAALRAGHI